jgi:hypothetical protein
VIAHGVGERADLPLPLSLVIIGGGIAIVASFLALGVLWRSPRLSNAKGRALPSGLQSFIDSPVVTSVLRLLTLALTLFVIVVAWAGPPKTIDNLAPWVLYVTFWVGLVPLSLLLGPVWARLNPLRTLYAGMARLTGPPPFADRTPDLGMHPAAVALLAFAWLELAAPSRNLPRTVGLFLVVYLIAQLMAAMAYGPGWFARGDGFEVYSRLLGRLAPLGRRDDGRLALRNPLDNAHGIEPVRGLWSVVVVLVGSTAFDGLTRSTAWQEWTFAIDRPATAATLVLVGSVVLVGALYLAAAWLAGRVAGRPGAADAFANSLVPIAAGYAIAHYFSLLLLDGQTTFLLASDPFNSGLNLFGTADNNVDYEVVSARFISLVQVAAIVIAHIVGLVLAHDRSLVRDEESNRPHSPVLAQVPMLLVMVVLTCAGLGLLLSS